MTLNQIHYFTVLAKAENMRQASELLFVSQPSLTVSLRKLEQELGVTLFDRIGHRIRLTADGRAFLAHCETIEAEVRNARIHMEELSTQRKTIINIGCVETLLREYLPERMRMFLETPGNYGVDFHIFEGQTPALTADLKKGKLDFVLGSEIEDESLEQKLLLQAPLIVIFRQDGKKPGGKRFGKAMLYPEAPCSWNELAKLPLLGYPKASVMDGVLEKMWLSEGIDFQYRYRMPNEVAIAALVANGFGVAIIPWVNELSGFPVNVFALPSGDYCRRLCILTQ